MLCGCTCTCDCMTMSASSSTASSSSGSTMWSSQHVKLASRIPTSEQASGVVRDQPRLSLRRQSSTTGLQSPLMEQFQSRLTDLDMLMEYKMVAERQLKGVFVLPSSNSLLEWHGVMFIHSGIYQGAVFHFTIFIPDGYPQIRPMVKFRTKVYHPYVHQSNNVVNMSRAFPDWDPSRHHICDVVAVVRRCFLQEDCWADQNSKVFIKQIRECVQESITSPIQTDPESLIQLSTTTDDTLEQARTLVHAGELPHEEESNSSFLGQVSAHVSKLLDSFIS